MSPVGGHGHTGGPGLAAVVTTGRVAAPEEPRGGRLESPALPPASRGRELGRGLSRGHEVVGHIDGHLPRVVFELYKEVSEVGRLVDPGEHVFLVGGGGGGVGGTGPGAASSVVVVRRHFAPLLHFHRERRECLHQTF